MEPPQCDDSFVEPPQCDDSSVEPPQCDGSTLCGGPILFDGFVCVVFIIIVFLQKDNN